VSRLHPITVFIRLGLAAAMLLAAAAASAQDASPDPADAGVPKIDYCPEGLENILPGDYYACRAVYHLQREHYSSAVESLREASHWANKNAQYMLGLMYFNGDTGDIAANRPLGLAWLALSAERRNPTYAEDYAKAKARSTPAEIREASTLYVRMKREYGDKVAGTRAMRQFNRNIQPINEAAQNGGEAYINGYTPLPQSAQGLVTTLHAEAEKDFEGLQGVVTVGAIQAGTRTPEIRPVAAPATGK
jgi:TPR repeat protein